MIIEGSLKGWGMWLVVIGVVVATFAKGNTVMYVALAIIAAGLTQTKVKRVNEKGE